MARFKLARYLFWGVLLVLVGCAPSTTNKPELSATSKPAPQSNPSAGSGQNQGEGQRGTTRESNAPGSLEALGKGQSSATPASSPLKDIYFDFDRYDLRADARDVLKTNADWLKSNPTARVEIEGHCDSRGTNEYNLALGAKRAQSAKDYLATLGIGADRLSTISYGSEIPVCQEQTEDCWARNRRARFVIIQGAKGAS
ncbi:MAG TPA: peptidoglycan-associated lipoprotein Pal [Candidatus Binatia bacterium]|jgi:peptidoglycan-associated lipoprotein